MPRLGGVGLVKALRHMGAGTPMILMSGHPMGEDPVELDELHIAAWVEKPPRPELLARALAEAIAGVLTWALQPHLSMRRTKQVVQECMLCLLMLRY